MSVYTSTLPSGLILTVATEITFGEIIIGSVLLGALAVLIFDQICRVIWI